MLKSSELREVLEKSGFSPRPDNKKTIEFTKDKTVLYVKMETGKEPLVAHPSTLDLLNAIGGIHGIEPNTESFYHSTSLRKFPIGTSSRGGENHRGLALEVSDGKALNVLLSVLTEGEGVNDPGQLPFIPPGSSGQNETERLRLASARIGQGKYRDDLLNLWKGCSVTGAKNPAMLKASHMKPWRHSDNKERLDPYNGLLLSANLDAAFDSGLITFSSQGDILISTSFSEASDFGIQPSMKLRKLDAQHQEYLTWHRDNEFKG